MDWLIIIFIIYGVISKLMGGNEKKNGRSRPGQRTTNRPSQSQRTNPIPETRPEPWTNQFPKQTKRPTFDPFDPFDPFSKDDSEKESPWPIPPLRKKVEFDEGVVKSEKLVEAPRIIEEIKDPYLKEASIVDSSNKKVAFEENKGSNRLTPSSEALVQGIIWSEVLGAPRGKRPHRTVSYKRIR